MKSSEIMKQENDNKVMECEKRFTTGMVLGKFCPLHLGHEYLIGTAAAAVERLYVVVDNIMDETIPVKLRMQWVKSRFPEAAVTTLPRPLPQDPSETPLFWDLWRNGLLGILPEHIDAVFASENYGQRLAAELGSTFVPVDLDRTTVPISATAIRADADQNWDFLSPAAKPWFCRKICVFGPESTGKSTLCSQLARHLDATLVHEYAEEVIVEKGGDIDFTDMSRIVAGHHQRIRQALQNPRPYLIVDTDAIASKIWARELFGRELPEVEEYIAAQDFDLYLLTDIDIEWKNDIHRYRPDNRQAFFDACRAELEHYHRPYSIVSGTGDDRLHCALSKIMLNA